SASSGLPVLLISTNPQVCTVSGFTVLTVAGGWCTITASQGGNSDYAAASAEARFRVYTGRETQTITFVPPPGAEVGVPVTLVASASSGLPVSFTSNTPTVCTVSGSTVLTAAAGVCVITASQNGSRTYAPARQVPRRFMVKLGQTITFA